MKFSKSLALLASMAMLTAAARAETLGAVGPVYPIAEQSALDTITNMLKQKQKSGELKRLEREAVERSMNSVKNMAPVEGLLRVGKATQRLIDPTVSYAKAVTTDEGQIVVPAGAKINPLTVVQLTKRLVFFDGTDKTQVNAVLAMMRKDPARVKPILVAGSWFDLTKAWKTQVYFDQRGTLSKRFGITAVPTVISQQGAYLQVDEVPAKDLK